MAAEGSSLFEFARSKGLGLPEETKRKIEGSPSPKSGAEHKVFFDAAAAEGRVIKVTFPEKFGRWEHTPFLYLERWALMHEIAPATRIIFEDSMQYFGGPHPTSQEADDFIQGLGFEPYRDGTTTLDYVRRESGIIIRDCHPGNWIKTMGTLIPVDIVPERLI